MICEISTQMYEISFLTHCNENTWSFHMEESWGGIQYPSLLINSKEEKWQLKRP